MLNRRALLSAIPLILAGCAASGDTPPTRTSDIWKAGEKVPSAKAVKGHPDYLDFGDGLKVPLDQHAFLTLWEGPNFWLTYGAGRAKHRELADHMAMGAAKATMQLLLMTLAFAPERLEHKNGGWRLKTQDMKNYIRGMLELPGKPFAPQTDASLGFGDMDKAFAAQETAMSMTGRPSAQIASVAPPVDMIGEHRIDAFTCYIVKKKDVSLGYVKKFARLDSLGMAEQHPLSPEK